MPQNVGAEGTVQLDMQAVQFVGVGQPLSIVRRPIPRPRPGWAVVKVRAVSLCGSDVHIREGHTPVGFTPISLGHEIAGDLVELAEEDREAGPLIGDRVFVNPIVGCGACHYCAAGESNLCPGRGLLGIRFDGGMAEYVAVPVRNITVITAKFSYAEIAMVESAGTAHHAVRVLAAEPGDSVVIIGAGGLGLQVIRIAIERGLRVVAVDPNVHARARALSVGAAHVTSPAEFTALVESGEYVALAEGLGSPFGFAHAVDCVGSDVTVNLAMRALRPRGSCSVIGIGDAAVHLPEPDVFVRRSLQVRGIYTFTEEDIASVIELFEAGHIDLSDSVSARLPLVDAERAFELFASEEERPVRVVLEL